MPDPKPFPRVLLVANYEPDEQISMQRFAGALQSGLTAEGCAVEVRRPLPMIGRLKPGATGVSKWLGYLDKFVWFPGRLRRRVRAALRQRENLVVHICDHSNSMYAAQLAGQPHVVTCHDLLAVRSARGEFPENPPRWSGRKLQQWIVRGLQTAGHVACVSEATRRDLATVRPASAPTSVILNGLNHPYSPLPAETAWATLAGLVGAATLSPVTPFILHVGGNVWYKNRPGVLKIYDAYIRHTRTAHRLVMVGPAFTPEMEALDARLPVARRAIRLSGATNEQLRALYSLAGVFLFPSLYEGFGWPIIEAQACGCAVLTTRAAPMTEVGGAAADYFAGGDTVEAVAKLRALIEGGAGERARWAEANRENVRRFSPARMAREYLDLYVQLARAAQPAAAVVRRPASPAFSHAE